MKSIAHALDSARRQFFRAAKDGTNPHLRNRYATLDSILEAVEPAMEAYGLTWLQSVETDPSLVLRTRIVHLESGESLDSVIPLLSDGGGKINPMQALGSSITYARRYGLECALGVLREDDDGEGAYHRPNEPNGRPPRHDDRFAPPTHPAQPPAARPAGPAQGRPAGPAAGRGGPQAQTAEGPPERNVTFESWLKGAASKLEVEQNWLLEQLHGSAVALGRMAAVEPRTIHASLARRWDDSLQGPAWRGWMRDECRVFAARLEEAGLQ